MNADQWMARDPSPADADQEELVSVDPVEAVQAAGKASAGSFLAARQEADRRMGNHHVYKLTRPDGQVRHEAGRDAQEALGAARRRGWIGWKETAAAEVVYSNGWADPWLLWRVEWLFAGRWIPCAQCMAPTAMHAIRVQQGLYGKHYRYRARRMVEARG